MTNEADEALSIFTTVAFHLFRQGRRAIVPSAALGAACRYRAPADDGTTLKCAIGCLIPDAEYSPTLEGKGIARLNQKEMLPPSIAAIYPTHWKLLQDLQNIHDSEVFWESPSLMRGALAALAERHCLPHTFLADLTFGPHPTPEEKISPTT